MLCESILCDISPFHFALSQVFQFKLLTALSDLLYSQASSEVRYRSLRGNRPFVQDKALAEADDESPSATNPVEAPPLKPASHSPSITSPASIPAPKQAKPSSSSKFTFSAGTRTGRPALPKAPRGEVTPDKGPDATSEKEEVGDHAFIVRSLLLMLATSMRLLTAR